MKRKKNKGIRGVLTGRDMISLIFVTWIFWAMVWSFLIIIGKEFTFETSRPQTMPLPTEFIHKEY